MRRIVMLAPAACLACVCGSAMADGLKPARTSLDDMRVLQKAFAAAAQAVAPSVVTVVADRKAGGSLSVRQVRVHHGRVQIRRGAAWRPAPGAGTGVVISPDGLILTSTHYTTGRLKKVLVVMPDGTPYEAKALGRDAGRQVSLLKIELEEGQTLPVPAFVDPDEVRVGQWVMALGRTYGELDPSVNVGIVSATGRIAGRAVQTDAPISPINYGGPLVDIKGRVVGVCTPMSNSPRRRGTQFYDSGIGFAVPVTDVLRVVPRLLDGAVLHPGFLGVQFDTARVKPGAAITRVVADSAAAKAGLKPKDVITECDGKSLRHAFDLMNRVGRKYVGEKVSLKVLRSTHVLDFTVTLGKRPTPRPRTRPTTRPTTRRTRRPTTRRAATTRPAHGRAGGDQ